MYQFLILNKKNIVYIFDQNGAQISLYKSQTRISTLRPVAICTKEMCSS